MQDQTDGAGKTGGAGGDGGAPGEGDDDLAQRRASLRYTHSSIEVPMANGNVMKIPLGNDNNDINISEEVNRSGVWKSLEGSSTNLESKDKHE